MIGFWARCFKAYFRMAMASMVQYRTAMAIWALWGLVNPLISLAVWTAAAGGSRIGNYNSQDFATYFLVLMVVDHICMSWDTFDFSYQVRNGTLSAALLRPIHPVNQAASYNVSFKVFTLTLLIPIWAVLFLLLHPSFHSTATDWLIAAPAVALAAVLRFTWNYLMGITAFWTTQVEALNQLYFTIDGFLAGHIAPLSLLPPFLQTLSYFTPFRSMIAFPVDLALGHLSGMEAIYGFLQQVIWMGIGFFLLNWVWRLGVKRYSAVGI